MQPQIPFDMEHETLDDLILGGLKIIQPQKGYRFSLDAVLLAHFVNLEKVKTVIDLGTGSGIIPLLLSYRSGDIEVIGIELQEVMADLARRSIAYNNLQNRLKVIQGDIKKIKQMLAGGSAELVVSNPPFWKKAEGKTNIMPEIAGARHEILVELKQIIEAAAYLLLPGGKAGIIHRADRLDEALRYFEEKGLTVKRLRTVHSFKNREASLVLIEGQKAGKSGMKVLSPLIIYDRPGEYSQEIQKIYRP